MKTTVLCFLIAFTITLCLASAATNRVVDVDGQDLQSGTEYYVLPVVRGNGGGLNMANGRNSKCPLDVVQEPNELNRGLKATFSPTKTTEKYIRVSSDLNIEFSGESSCAGSTNVWRLDDLEAPNGTTYVSTGGVIGNPGASTFNCWFRIEKLESENNWYKLRFCPTVCKQCTPVCGDAGVIIEKSGTRRLALNTGKAFQVFFKKA